jgi:iron complex outermembrane receptor protein
VRAPSRLDSDAHIPGVPPFLLDGGATVRAEVARVYSLGYRTQPTPRLAASMTVFHTNYDDLVTLEIDPSLTFVNFANGMRGRANGIEAWASFQVAPGWRLMGGYTALDEELRLKPGSNDVAAPLASGNNPSHTAQLRSAWRIGERVELDLAVRRVAALARHEVPAYTAVDARIGWKSTRSVEFSITGRNLFGRHAEYGPATTRSVLGRSLYLNFTWNL